MDGIGLLVGDGVDVVGAQCAAEVEGDAFADEHAQRSAAFRDARGGVQGNGLPDLVGVGCLAHLLGDSLTKMGVPWLWPRRTRYEIEIIKSSGNKLETEILVPLMGVGTIALLWFTALAPHQL